MTYLISRYEVTRAYGGPEEGGRWWDCWQFAEVVATADSKDKAEYAAQMLSRGAMAQEEEEAGGHLPAGQFSVNGGADTRFMAEVTAGENEETDKPMWC